ncbi:MAG: SgcJ/EcaC family oxidoreductase [Rhodococcus sp. (in: high G+C Gram-positive bacteria)]|nr:MAG: SgcJ/EcaC family oxidoreductase [Rhodococcus sp. (in: high G+C Gram-positive bacteria)]
MSTFDREELADVHRSVVRAIEDRDPALFASLYTDTGTLLTPDGRSVGGRDAIAEEFGHWLAAGLVAQTLEDVELTIGDTVAVEEGRAIGEFAAGSEVHSNYIVVHIRQDDGSWLMHRDIWTRIGAHIPAEVSY